MRWVGRRRDIRNDVIVFTIKIKSILKKKNEVLLFVATWIALDNIVFKSNEPQNETQLLLLLIFTRMLG